MLIQKVKNIFAPRQPVEAALSHTSQQCLQEFLAADGATFDETSNHRQIGQHARRYQGGRVEREAIQFQLHVRIGCFFEISPY